MRSHLLWALVLPAFFPVNTSAKTTMYCYQNVASPGASGGGHAQANGFVIEVKPSRNPDPDLPVEVACHATIRSSTGKLVFELYDWGVGVDSITGKDVNGDGQPDAVISTFSGGAHCCSTYYVVSLGKKPGLIRKFGNRFDASLEELKLDHKVEILIREEAFDEGFGLPHPYSPFPLLIVRLNGEKFEEVSAEFWSVYEKEIRETRSKITPENLSQFLSSDPGEPSDNDDDLRTEADVLMIVLDYLYAGKALEAKEALATMWPVTSQRQAWDEMTKGYCSRVRTQLAIDCPPIQ